MHIYIKIFKERKKPKMLFNCENIKLSISCEKQCACQLCTIVKTNVKLSEHNKELKKDNQKLKEGFSIAEQLIEQLVKMLEKRNPDGTSFALYDLCIGFLLQKQDRRNNEDPDTPDSQNETYKNF